jgi:hypothetical protein
LPISTWLVSRLFGINPVSVSSNIARTGEIGGWTAATRMGFLTSTSLTLALALPLNLAEA